MEIRHHIIVYYWYNILTNNNLIFSVHGPFKTRQDAQVDADKHLKRIENKEEPIERQYYLIKFKKLLTRKFDDGCSKCNLSFYDKLYLEPLKLMVQNKAYNYIVFIMPWTKNVFRNI